MKIKINELKVFNSKLYVKINIIFDLNTEKDLNQLESAIESFSRLNSLEIEI